jgi:hypothetical protein
MGNRFRRVAGRASRKTEALRIMKTRITLLLAFLPASAFAGTSTPEQIANQPTETHSDWWLSVTPYGWITATDGDMGVAGRVAPVDISFKDTLENLELAFMLSVEGGIGRWAFGFDGIYGAFSDNASLPPAAAPYSSATIDFDQFLSRVHAGYQVVSTETATLTAFAGVRYSYLSTEIGFSGPGAPDLDLDGSKSWIDPVIGLNGSWEINDRWHLRGGGDIGGFGVSSDLIWQINAAIGYRIRENLSVLAGYRGFGVDYSSGGFLMDTVAHGPVIGLSYRF